jgi:hypothetical protein
MPLEPDSEIIKRQLEAWLGRKVKFLRQEWTPVRLSRDTVFDPDVFIYETLGEGARTLAYGWVASEEGNHRDFAIAAGVSTAAQAVREHLEQHAK